MYDLPTEAYWALAGLIVGLGSYFISTKRRTGLAIFSPALLGALGGVLAGFLGREVLDLGTAGQVLQGIAVAAAGAAVLLVIHGLIAK